MTRLLAPTLMALLLAGCSNSWLGEKEAAPLPGTRVPVLVFDQQMQADPELASQPLHLPDPVTNGSWTTAGGNPAHAGGALALADSLHAAWKADIGDGVSDTLPLLPVPVIESGVIYAMDSNGTVTALSADNGKELWSAELAPRSLRDKASGGGIAVAGGQLFATLGYGEVVSLSTDNGTELWREKISSPLRSAPAVGSNQVFVLGIDNQLGALDARTGSINWVHTGMVESAGLLGAPSPAVTGEMVLVAYSSGELYALRTQNGGEIWSDNIASNRREGGVMSIAAIRGMPVLTAGGIAALAVSNSGRLVAIDTRSGQRVWEQRVSGLQMPWVAGETVFLVTAQAQLMAVNLPDGKIRWVQQLDLWENPDDKQGVISWYGPVLAGGQLWLTNSLGQLQSYHPATGTFTASYKLGDSTSRPPLVAGGTLYTLDDDARLTAWR